MAYKFNLGISSGLVGGAVFGVMMAIAGMYPMISSMVGMENAVVGFVIHLIISIIIGVVFSLLLGDLIMGGPDLRAVLVGGVYGLVWWVLGPLLIMPAVLGMPLFAVEAQTGSLFGHVIFGIVMGFAYRTMRTPNYSTKEI